MNIHWRAGLDVTVWLQANARADPTIFPAEAAADEVLVGISVSDGSTVLSKVAQTTDEALTVAHPHWLWFRIPLAALQGVAELTDEHRAPERTDGASTPSE